MKFSLSTIKSIYTNMQNSLRFIRQVESVQNLLLRPCRRINCTDRADFYPSYDKGILCSAHRSILCYSQAPDNISLSLITVEYFIDSLFPSLSLSLSLSFNYPFSTTMIGGHIYNIIYWPMIRRYPRYSVFDATSKERRKQNSLAKDRYGGYDIALFALCGHDWPKTITIHTILVLLKHAFHT